MLSKMEKLKALETELREKIKGQDHVISEIADLLQRGEIGLMEENKPRSSFLFLGPTGVGKTETVKAFTEFLFGGDKLHRLDMSEFMHFDSIKELRGDETGNAGRLGAVLEKHEDGTLLFDEIEKAHPQIMDLFLQALDDARVTLGNGKTYDLSNFYLVFTSNIGASRLTNIKKMSYERIKKNLMIELKMRLRPETVNRFEKICVFKFLEVETQKDIAEEMLKNECGRLSRMGYSITYDSNLIDYAVRNGIDRNMGARPLKRCIGRVMQNAIIDDLLNNDGDGCGEIAVDLNINKVYMTKTQKTEVYNEELV